MERKRILLAVSSPTDIEELRKSLVVSGYEVKVVNDGAIALKLCREFRPHLVCSELTLPKIDGHHLLRELKPHSETKLIPFVLISKHRSVSERIHSIKLGVDDYITTPFDAQEVILRFEILLNEIKTIEALPRRSSKGFSGKLSDMNLIELIQTLEIGKKSGIVKLESSDDSGVLFINNGEIFDVSLHDLPPRQALFRMFTWKEGTFRIEFRTIDQKNDLNESSKDIIYQGLKFKDRWERLCQSLPPLQTTVKRAEKIVAHKLSNDEKSLLNLVDGKNRMVDIIYRSKFDDLRTLEIVANLYAKDMIVEVPLDEVTRNGKAKVQEKHNLNGDSGNILKIVNNFLSVPEKQASKRPLDRRKNDRRKTRDRRNRYRRWSDYVGQQNQIFLNKSELLMIRQKLANGYDKSNEVDNPYI